jgi:hypothetical protein
LRHCRYENTCRTTRVVQKTKHQATVRSFTLFSNPKHKKDIKIDYVGIRIPNKLVGFGLDYDGLGRNLKEVYQLKNNYITHIMTNIVFFGNQEQEKELKLNFLKGKVQVNAPVNRRYFSIQYKKCYRMEN